MKAFKILKFPSKQTYKFASLGIQNSVRFFSFFEADGKCAKKGNVFHF